MRKSHYKPNVYTLQGYCHILLMQLATVALFVDKSATIFFLN